MRDRLRAFRVLLALGYQADRRQWLVLFTATVLGQVAGLAVTYGTKLLTDAVVRHTLEAALQAALLIAVAGGVGQICWRLYLQLTIQIEEKAGQLLDRWLVALTAGIPGIEHHERPEYVNELDLLRGQRSLLAQLTNATVLNFRVYVQVIGTVILLARLQPLLVLLPLFGFGAFWTGRKANELQEAAAKANVERVRTKSYLRGLATSVGAAKEFRLFGLGDEILGRFHAVSGTITREMDGSSWKITALTVLGSLCFAVGYVGAILLVVVRAVNGLATPGDVVLAVGLAAQVSTSVATIIGMGNYLGRALRAARRYLWLLDYAAQASVGAADPAPVPDHLASGITVAHLSFRYPGTDAPSCATCRSTCRLARWWHLSARTAPGRVRWSSSSAASTSLIRDTLASMALIFGASISLPGAPN